MKTALVCLLVALGGCRSAPRAQPSASDSATGVADTELAQLCRDAWESELEFAPRMATELGDARGDARLEDNSPAGDKARAAVRSRLLERALGVPQTRLANEDRITRRLLIERWREQQDEFALDIDVASWNLDGRGGPQNEFLTLGPDQPARSPAQQSAALERWHAMPRYIDQCCTNLRRGLAHGRVASAKAVADTLAQLETLLATPPGQSPLVAAAKDDAPFRARLEALVAGAIYPAFARYRDCIRDEIAPRARDDRHPGVCNVEGGAAYYRLCILRETSLDLAPSEIHAYGMAEVARIREEIGELGQRLYGTRALPEIRARLEADPAQHFTSAEAILGKARATLARAVAAQPRLFGQQPRAACEVWPIPEHEAPFSTLAYYRPGAQDGSRGGRYYVNTYAPSTRLAFEAEALCFHESVPGHHLQITLAQENQALPLVRRQFAQNAFVEGWALYCERLADEQQLYSGESDRLGMLSYDAWRASRLVVDTGLHAFGWSRGQALRFLEENTLLAPNNVENEVDRYIAWPGQALGYKLGQREILRLREEARAKLGRRFRLADFHDRLLESGGVSLAVLGERIRAWIAVELAKPEPPRTGTQ
ncbi:MAG: DUF885 domain-containing protein [Planctomycetes bacterium]|nr:DUF885 domain-containing protein [Planctomycetota bacterium]